MRAFRRSSVAFTLAAALLSTSIASIAATLPAGFAETRIATGLASPTAMTFAPDGRLFVAQQGGALRVIRNGVLLSQPFVTLSVSSAGERGLLGVAFDPNFAINSFVYVYYTTSTSPIHNRLSRFTANGDVAASGSEVQILNLPSLSSATNHNGGAIHFGNDGRLYIAVGDNATPSNAPALTTTLGKVLRINSDGSIPADHPFLSQTTGINQAIWVRGLRNPFNFAVDPASGRIHVNDVGQDSWEEVNLGAAGANYGWPATEGPSPGGVAGVTYPIHAYQNAGSNCAITGAAFYRASTQNFPAEYNGRYFFGDFCGGFIRTLSPPGYTASTGFATGVSSLVDIQIGPEGALYYFARGGEHLCDAHGADEQRAERIDHDARNGLALSRRRCDLVRRNGRRCGRRQSAAEQVHVARRLPPRRSHASARTADERRLERNVHDRESRRDLRQCVLSPVSHRRGFERADEHNVRRSAAAHGDSHARQ